MAIDFLSANLADGHISKTGQHGLEHQTVLPVHFLERSAIVAPQSASQTAPRSGTITFDECQAPSIPLRPTAESR
jgi:hypothetical protein